MRLTCVLGALLLLFLAAREFPRLTAGTAAPRLEIQDTTLAELAASGVAAERREDFAAAGAAYGRAIQRFPRHAQAWAQYGEYLRFYAHDEARAQAAFERAVQAPVADPAAVAFALRGLGDMAGRRGDLPRAIQYLAQSLEICPLADTHRTLCHLHGCAGDFERAAFHSQRAVELAPDDPIALLLHASQLKRNGRSAEAQAAFERALRLAGCDPGGGHEAPVHCCVLLNAAGFHAVCGEREQALKMLAAFFDTPNHRHLPRTHFLEDPDFAALRSDSAFTGLLDKYLPQ